MSKVIQFPKAGTPAYNNRKPKSIHPMFLQDFWMLADVTLASVDKAQQELDLARSKLKTLLNLVECTLDYKTPERSVL